MLRNIFIVGTGGFIGSVMRYLLQIAVEKGLESTFPFGTFIANISGSFIIGMVYALSEKGTLMGPGWRLFLAVGICGGYTTFSSFSYNNLNLLKDNSITYFLFNTGGSLFLGILAVYLGIVFTRMFI